MEQRPEIFNSKISEMFGRRRLPRTGRAFLHVHTLVRGAVDFGAPVRPADLPGPRPHVSRRSSPFLNPLVKVPQGNPDRSLGSSVWTAYETPSSRIDQDLFVRPVTPDNASCLLYTSPSPRDS